MKKHGTTIMLFIVLFVGLSLLLYPSFSDWWNSMHQTQAVASYVEQVTNINEKEYQELWENAAEYNRQLSQRDNPYALTPELKDAYVDILDIIGTGIMGYVEIPVINVTLPIYHSTSESVLQVAAGHVEWSSLPVGGESTHSVISGHRGLPSARLLTDLDKLVEGDVFIYRILDEVLTYEVDQILIVEPHQVDQLAITEGKDYSTLVTCTPYGINSHRILVRGHRIENLEVAKQIRVSADAIQIDPVVVAPFMASPMLLILLIMLIIPKKRRG